MPIDWTTRERELNLVYLFEGSYHDENGVERLVHWCGPKARTGSGLSVATPVHSAMEKSVTCVWEARLNRCSLELDMGNIDQTIGAISDLTFSVDISGGSQASVPVAGELRRDIVYGRWRGRTCRIWLYDLDTGDTQVMGRGSFDRDPTSIGPNSFQIVVDIAPLLSTTQWPQGRIPMNTDGFTVPSVGSYWRPTQFYLNPEHVGKFLGLSFGDGAVVESTYTNPTSDNWVWKEVVPYGRRTSDIGPLGSHYVYAWVSPQFNCFVDNIWYENSEASQHEDALPIINTTNIETFENRNPNVGPIGTIVRFFASNTDSSIPQNPLGFRWWEGSYPRVVARVSGAATGVPDTSVVATDFNGGIMPGTTVYKKSLGGVRAAVWQIIEDIITRPELLDRSDVLGSGSILDFKNSAPTVSKPVPWANMACTVPAKISDKPLPAREAFGELARCFPFDFAQRYDTSADDWRWYPVWRSGFTTEPSYIFGVEDMSRTDAPAVAQYNNSDGKYANEVLVDTIEYIGSPVWPIPSGDANTVPDIMPMISPTRFRHNDTFEQLPTKQGEVVTTDLKMKHWQHYSDDGNSSAAWQIGEERSQPQRTVQATHGVRSFRVQMGAAIKYDMVGINSDVGMVRKMRFDFDLQQVQITSYHIDHSTPRSKPRGDNEAFNQKKDE